MGFKKLMYGFIFLYNINIRGIDILPDIIGYVLFIFGLSQLLDKSECFKDALKTTIILVVLSVIEIGVIAFGLEGILLRGILGGAIIIFRLILVYGICMGVEDYANKEEEFELSTKARNRWELYCFAVIISCYIWAYPYLSVIISLSIFIYITAVIILLMGLMKKAADLRINSVSKKKVM